MKAQPKSPKKLPAKGAKKPANQAAAKSPKSANKAAAKSPKSANKPARKPATRSPARLREVDPTSNAALLELSIDYEASPDMPVAVAVQEFNSLVRLAQRTAGALAKVGITRGHLDTMQRFAKQLGGRETDWQKARTGVALSATERKSRLAAEELDAKLLAGGRWACRKDEAALAELDRIAEGSGLDDTIQDLYDLVAFWEAHASELAYTDITAKDLSHAVQLAQTLAPAADKESHNLDAASALALRNRCFWAATELAKEIRAGGRYAYRLQPKMAAKFVSRYRLATNRRARSKTKDAQLPEAAPSA